MHNVVWFITLKHVTLGEESRVCTSQYSRDQKGSILIMAMHLKNRSIGTGLCSHKHLEDFFSHHHFYSLQNAKHNTGKLSDQRAVISHHQFYSLTREQDFV